MFLKTYIKYISKEFLETIKKNLFIFFLLFFIFLFFLAINFFK